MLKSMVIYLNNDVSTNYEQFGEFCENEEAEENCCGIGYEIKIEGKFNTKTGKFFAYKFNDVDLISLVEV